MICFYLKYVNMYASIYFLVCISVRRCELIVRPLRFSSCRRKGDLLICVLGWLLVSLCCLPFLLLRSTGTYPYSLATIQDDSHPPSEARTIHPRYPLVCFSELPMRTISLPGAEALLIMAELLGFVIPLLVVVACSCLTAGSLRETTGVGGFPDRGEKRRALRMVLSCAVVFLLCFAPYHVTMPLDFMVKAGVVGSCSAREAIQRSHPVTLCLASLNCCLDPLMYYFTTEEFRRRLSKPEIPDIMSLRRLSCISGEDLQN